MTPSDHWLDWPRRRVLALLGALAIGAVVAVAGDALDRFALLVIGIVVFACGLFPLVFRTSYIWCLRVGGARLAAVHTWLLALFIVSGVGSGMANVGGSRKASSVLDGITWAVFIAMIAATGASFARGVYRAFRDMARRSRAR